MAMGMVQMAWAMYVHPLGVVGKVAALFRMAEMEGMRATITLWVALAEAVEQVVTEAVQVVEVATQGVLVGIMQQIALVAAVPTILAQILSKLVDTMMVMDR